MTTATLLALAGLAITIAIFAAGAIFGAGGLKARVDDLEEWKSGVDEIIAQGGLLQRIKSLEEWRVNMRADMHEISDILSRIDRHTTAVDERLKGLDDRVKTLLERRGQAR